MLLLLQHEHWSPQRKVLLKLSVKLLRQLPKATMPQMLYRQLLRAVACSLQVASCPSCTPLEAHKVSSQQDVDLLKYGMSVLSVGTFVKCIAVKMFLVHVQPPRYTCSKGLHLEPLYVVNMQVCSSNILKRCMSDASSAFDQ